MTKPPDLENRKAWQWGGCGDNLKYSNKFVKDFLGKRSNKDLRARVDMHNTNVGMKVHISDGALTLNPFCTPDGHNITFPSFYWCYYRLIVSTGYFIDSIIHYSMSLHIGDVEKSLNQYTLTKMKRMHLTHFLTFPIFNNFIIRRLICQINFLSPLMNEC